MYNLSTVIEWRTFKIPSTQNGAYILLSAIIAGIAIVFNYIDIIQVRQKEHNRKYLTKIKELVKEVNTTLENAISLGFNHDNDYIIKSSLHTELFAAFTEIGSLFKDLKFDNASEKKKIQNEIYNYFNHDYIDEFGFELTRIASRILNIGNGYYNAEIYSEYVEILSVFNELNIKHESPAEYKNTTTLFRKISEYKERLEQEESPTA